MWLGKGVLVLFCLGGSAGKLISASFEICCLGRFFSLPHPWGNPQRQSVEKGSGREEGGEG